MFISQNHPKSQQRVRTSAVKEKPVFRASLALSMLEIELYEISHFQWQSEIWVRDYSGTRLAERLLFVLDWGHNSTLIFWEQFFWELLVSECPEGAVLAVQYLSP